MNSTIDESQAKPQRPSRLRVRQKELTEELVMNALVDILDRDRRYEFSMQEVADLAGVSHRCLYAHFPTREKLLDAFSMWINEKVGERWIPSLPSSGHELPSWTQQKFAQIAKQPALTRAATVARLARKVRSASARTIDQKFTEIISGVAPGLGQDKVRRATALVRHLSSGQTWLVLTEQLGLSDKEAGEAASWAIKVLTADLENRNAALSHLHDHSREGEDGDLRKDT